MLDVMMKNGNFRVDYLNPMPSQPARMFAFYVCGSVADHEHYGHDVKKRLFVGLDVIKRMMGMENLAAVYLDVNDSTNVQRPGYEQMKRDLADGLFRRIFVLRLDDLFAGSEMMDDLMTFSMTIGGFEVLVYDAYSRKPEPFVFLPYGLMYAEQPACC